MPSNDNDTPATEDGKCPSHDYIVTSVGEYVVVAECNHCEKEVQVLPKRSRDYKVGERL